MRRVHALWVFVAWTSASAVACVTVGGALGGIMVGITITLAVVAVLVHFELQVREPEESYEAILREYRVKHDAWRGRGRLGPEPPLPGPRPSKRWD